MTIPGVDYLTALTIIAEIGRFSTPWKLVSVLFKNRGTKIVLWEIPYSFWLPISLPVG